MDDLRYPIGRFVFNEAEAEAAKPGWIGDIASTPSRLRAAVQGLSDEQLDTPYRPGGWSVRQVVHHVPDSHMNSYVRFKLALTEENPIIRTYDQHNWAQLPDTRYTATETSLALLESLHARWVQLLTHMQASDYTRTLNHPEMGVMTLLRTLGLYAWHGNHHIAHIVNLKEREGWK